MTFKKRSARAQLRGKPFGKIFPFAKNVERLQRFLVDAEHLKNLRNVVAVHPLCFWPFESDETMINEVIIQDLKKHNSCSRC